MSIKQNYEAGFRSGTSAKCGGHTANFRVEADDTVTGYGQSMGKVGRVSRYVQGYLDGYDASEQCPAG